MEHDYNTLLKLYKNGDIQAYNDYKLDNIYVIKCSF